MANRGGFVRVTGYKLNVPLESLGRQLGLARLVQSKRREQPTLIERIVLRKKQEVKKERKE